jgi:hypothetical protein
MDFIFKEYKVALVFYVGAGFLYAAFAPWVTTPFLWTWFSVVVSASGWFFVWVFVRAAILSFARRKKD